MRERLHRPPGPPPPLSANKIMTAREQQQSAVCSGPTLGMEMFNCSPLPELSSCHNKHAASRGYGRQTSVSPSNSDLTHLVCVGLGRVRGHVAPWSRCWPHCTVSPPSPTVLWAAAAGVLRLSPASGLVSSSLQWAVYTRHRSGHNTGQWPQWLQCPRQ